MVLLPLVRFDQAHEARAEGAQAYSYDRELARELGLLQLDPLVAEIEKNSADSQGFIPQISAHDPLVDANPFFMTGQSWTSEGKVAQEDLEEAAYEETESGVWIRPAGIERALYVPAPLHPVLATDEYLYLTARDAAYFKAHGDGQGLFVIPNLKLIENSATGAHVPVFYFPLPGKGWTGDLQVREIPERDLITVSNSEGFDLPIELEDVRQVVKNEATTLMFAVHEAMMDASEKLRSSPDAQAKLKQSLLTLAESVRKNSKDDSKLEKHFAAHKADIDRIYQDVFGSEEIELRSGATAGFGILYLGPSAAKPKRTSWMEFLLPSAQAMDPQVAQFLGYTARVLGTASVVFIGGIVARYSILKAVAQKRIEAGKAEGDLKVARRFKWDVFAHSMTTLAQIPSVWSAKTLQYTLDRVGVSENNAIRKLFNKTFGFALRTNDKTPVSARSLMLGVIVLGGVDTALVAIQGYFLLQWMADGLAWMVPSLAERVHAAYHSGDSAVALFLLLGVIQNLVAWIVGGASTYAHDMQTAKENEGAREVAKKMKDENKDPESPKYQDEYRRRVVEYRDNALAMQGLDKKSFLFDANTLYASLVGFFGYKDTRAAPEGEELGKLRALERPGLTFRALKAALKLARAELKQDPTSEEKQQALANLEDTATRLSPLNRFYQWFKKNESDPSALFSAEVDETFTPKNLKALATEYRNIRTELAALTVEGQVTDVPSDLPSTWTSKGQEGARLSASYFRKAFFGLIDNAKKANPFYGWMGRVISFPFRFANRLFESWQIRRAKVRATAHFVKKHRRTPDLSSKDDSAKWEKDLKTELTRAMGLNPEYADDALLAKVEKEAQSRFGKRMETDTDFFTDLDRKISDVKARMENARKDTVREGLENRLQSLIDERDTREALLEAEYFSDVYTEMTVQRDADSGGYSQLDARQPGLFQKWRNTKFVKNRSRLNTALRGAEGVFSNTRYRTGLWNKLLRIVPALDDIIQGNLIVFRNFPISATVGYWWTMTVWGSAMPRPTWFINSVLLAGTTIRAGWMTTQRMTANMGVKPGNDVGGMVRYGLIGSFATMWGMFLYPIFKPELEQVAHGAYNACVYLLSAGGHL